MNFKKIRKSKKGMSQTWWIISTAVIALILVVLIISWFQGSGGKAFGNVGTQIDNLGDCDNDGVANMFDKCPCLSFGNEENSEADGCPEGQGAKECSEQEKNICENN